MTERLPKSDIRVPRGIYHWMPEQIDFYDFAAFVHVCHRAGRDGWCYESVENMHKALGMRRQTLQEVLTHMVELGLLEKIKSSPNKYRAARPFPVPGGSWSTDGPSDNAGVGAQTDQVGGASWSTNDPELVHQRTAVGPPAAYKHVEHEENMHTRKTEDETLGQNTREIIARHCDLFKKKYGHYNVTGADIGKVQQLVHDTSVTTVMERLNHFHNGGLTSTTYHRRHPGTPPTLGLFAMLFNEMAVTATSTAKARTVDEVRAERLAKRQAQTGQQ